MPSYDSIIKCQVDYVVSGILYIQKINIREVRKPERYQVTFGNIDNIYRKMKTGTVIIVSFFLNSF